MSLRHLLGWGMWNQRVHIAVTSILTPVLDVCIGKMTITYPVVTLSFDLCMGRRKRNIDDSSTSSSTCDEQSHHRPALVYPRGAKARSSNVMSALIFFLWRDFFRLVTPIERVLAGMRWRRNLATTPPAPLRLGATGYFARDTSRQPAIPDSQGNRSVTLAAASMALTAKAVNLNANFSVDNLLCNIGRLFSFTAISIK